MGNFSHSKDNEKLKHITPFKVGDTINVSVNITEGKRSRIQIFTGLVIAIKNSGINRNFVVRKIAAGNIGVERIFPLYSPIIKLVDIASDRSVVRRAKLYYIRELRGKAARLKEKKYVKTIKNKDKQKV